MANRGGSTELSSRSSRLFHNVAMLPRIVRSVALAAFIVFIPAAARAQAVLKVNDSISVRLGFLSQTWADFSENVRQDSSYAQNIFQRRLRFIVGMRVGPIRISVARGRASPSRSARGSSPRMHSWK